MATRGYTVNGSREMMEVGVEALEALGTLLDNLGDDADLAEFKVFENLPVEATIVDDMGISTYVWNRSEWEMV